MWNKINIVTHLIHQKLESQFQNLMHCRMQYDQENHEHLEQVVSFESDLKRENYPSGNDPKSSLPERRAPGAERPEILSKQFSLKIFLDFFLEKILKIEKPMQICSQKCLYA